MSDASISQAPQTQLSIKIAEVICQPYQQHQICVLLQASELEYQVMRKLVPDKAKMTVPLANCLEFLAAMSVFLPIPCRNNALDLSLSLTFDPVLVTLQVSPNCVTSVPTDISLLSNIIVNYQSNHCVPTFQPSS